MSFPTARVCKRCGITLPPPALRKRRGALCSQCQTPYRREQLAAQPAWVTLPSPGYEKLCSACGKLQPSSAYRRRPTANDGLRGICLSCEAARSRVRYATEPEYKAKHDASARKWEHTNRPAVNERQERWRALHPESAFICNLRRRSAIVPEAIPAVKAFYAWARSVKHVKCYLCGKPVSKRDRQVDHVTPVRLGGKNVPENLSVMHASCNHRKQAKPPHAVGLLF